MCCEQQAFSHHNLHRDNILQGAQGIHHTQFLSWQLRRGGYHQNNVYRLDFLFTYRLHFSISHCISLIDPLPLANKTFLSWQLRRGGYHQNNVYRLDFLFTYRLHFSISHCISLIDPLPLANKTSFTMVVSNGTLFSRNASGTACKKQRSESNPSRPTLQTKIISTV